MKSPPFSKGDVCGADRGIPDENAAKAADHPHAPGAKHPQPYGEGDSLRTGWRAQRCQPTTFMNHPPVWGISYPTYPAAEPLACISKAALYELCAATFPSPKAFPLSHFAARRYPSAPQPPAPFPRTRLKALDPIQYLTIPHWGLYNKEQLLYK